MSIGRISLSLRIHDTLVPKTTANLTFVPFLCCHLINTQDRPHKVYISFKLRAFYTYFKKEKHSNGTLGQANHGDNPLHPVRSCKSALTTETLTPPSSYILTLNTLTLQVFTNCKVTIVWDRNAFEGLKWLLSTSCFSYKSLE